MILYNRKQLHETTESNVEKAKISLWYYIGGRKYKNKINRNIQK